MNKSTSSNMNFSFHKLTTLLFSKKYSILIIIYKLQHMNKLPINYYLIYFTLLLQTFKRENRIFLKKKTVEVLNTRKTTLWRT